MSIALADLVTRLQVSVPVKNGVPADYMQICKDAVYQLGNDVPLIRRASLALVSGTDTYALVENYAFLIGFEQYAQDEVLITDTGLIPLGLTSDRPQHIVQNGQVTFIPAPGYSGTLYYQYGAQYILSGDEGSEVYADLTQNGGRIALLYAQYLALNEQAAQSGGGWRYQLGDEMVDKSRLGDDLRNQANQYLRSYEQAIAPMRTVGTRSRYGSLINAL